MSGTTPPVEEHAGPALLDSRDVAFVLAATRDGKIHLINNVPGSKHAVAFTLRHIADELDPR